jgi:two-component system, NtrC family, sensor histidine kinase AtoS
MRRASANSLAIFSGSPRLETSEIESLLDLAPQAALLVDARSRRLLAANDEARRIFGSTVEALCALSLDQLFPGFALALDVRGEGTEEAALLTGEQQFVHARVIPLPGRGRRSALLFEPFEKSSGAGGCDEPSDSTEVWRALSELLLAVTLPSENKRLEIDMGRVLDAALRASARLLDCQAGLAVYLVRPDGPGLERAAASGSGDRLPVSLPPQELVHLLQPQTWRPEQRTYSSLHRTARQAGFRYLATAPVGSAPAKTEEAGQAVSGLIAIGSQESEMPATLPAALPYIAGLIQDLLVWRAFLVHIEGLLENQRYNRGVFEVLERSQEEGLIGLTPELNIRLMNSAAESILGYNQEELQGHPVENLLIGTESLASILQLAQNGRTVYGSDQLRLFRRNGEAFPAQLRLLPVKVRDRQLGVLVLLKDRSEHEQVREHTQALEQRALLGEVTAVFAHEVRNPINNISTGLQVMAMELPPDHPNQPVLERMLADCDRLEELMKSVLAFSRPTDYVMEPVDLPALLNRTLDRLRPRMVRASVKDHFQIEEGLPAVEGNPRALEQVFFNLMNNAIQAMGTIGGGHLAIKARMVPRDPAAPAVPGFSNGSAYLQVSVADTGPGIPKEDVDRIFQPFFTTRKDGAGLGLAIAKRIITAHKGDLRLDSFAGGTVFTIHLPFAANRSALKKGESA